VLGAGLINGEKVTPLLARRIDKAINIYQRQLRKKKKPIMIIMSGGKGGDEKLSEAEAMCQYALEQGIPQEHILLETNSKNTYENMKFSKEIIKEREGKRKAKVLFATTNYHVFRAGIYAKKAGLNAQGIGSKTPFYFWYNAILREFVAILSIYRKSQLVIVSLLVVFGGILYYLLTHLDVVKSIFEFIGII
ncbi:MAG: YdcF family protein, partial [Coprobacillaceae bacterium]